MFSSTVPRRLSAKVVHLRPSSSTRLTAAAAATTAATFSTSARLSRTDNPVPANNPAPEKAVSPVSSTNAVPTSSEGSMDAALQESVEDGERMRVMQAPNRKGVWSRSQRPREEAMVGPRFEQTIMAQQPLPYSAIELIHKQPVRWTKERQVSCDGGGGPLGHPRIFINVDRPQICWCTYCGLPFAHEQHRKMLEAQEHTTYPLEPTGHEAEVPESQSNTGRPLEQR